jgi:hypothetical protein
VAQRSVSAVEMEEGGRRSSDTVEIEDGGRQWGGRGGECRDERCYGAAMAGGWRVGVGRTGRMRRSSVCGGRMRRWSVRRDRMLEQLRGQDAAVWLAAMVGLRK